MVRASQIQTCDARLRFATLECGGLTPLWTDRLDGPPVEAAKTVEVFPG
jgi:hypothetical protein